MAVVCSSAGSIIRGAARTDSAALLALSLGSSSGRSTELYGVQGSSGRVSGLGIATSVRVRQNVLAQFQNTLSNSVYVVPFGDGVGDLQVTFLANPQCGATNNSSLSNIWNHYKTNRLQPKQTRPARLSVGPVTLTGHLIGFVIDAQGSSTGMVQGTLVFKAWL